MNQSMERTNHICLLIVTAIVITFSLHFTKDVLVPLAFSLVIYEALLPIVHFLERKWKVPPVLAALISFVVFLGIMLAMILFVTNTVGDIVKLSELYKAKFASAGVDLMNLAGNFGMEKSQAGMLGVLKELPLLGTVKSFALNLADFVGQLSLVVLLVGYLIFGGRTGFPKKHFFVEVNEKISKYLATKFISSFITAILVATILAFADADLVLAFALLTFILNFIPSIGSVIATLLPLPIIALKFGLGFKFMACMLLIGGIQFTIGNVLEPKVMGNNLNLHPIAILCFLLFWGIVWGVPGMFLAVPITASLKILLEKMEATRPFARLLEGKLS
jgi:AI-2 transport protein TqsA